MIKIADDPVDVDIDRLVLLLCNLDKIHHEAAPERFPLHSLEQRKEDIQKIFGHGCVFYAEYGSQIIGFASVLEKGDALVIEHLFVKPEFRLNKVATKLVESIFAKFPAKEIFTSVYAFNSEAIKFYEKLFKLSSLVFKR